MRKTAVFAVLFIFIFSVLHAAGAAEKKWMKKGNELYAKRQYQKAAGAYERALAANPKNTKAHLYAGYCYAYAGKKSRAIALLEAAYKKTRDKKLGAYIKKLKGGGAAKPGFSDVYLKGGVGRLAAMGNVDISVPDASSVIDLYDAGFTSSVLSRKKANVKNASPAFAFRSRKTVQDNPAEDTSDSSGFDISTNMYREKNNGALFWLSNDNVLVIKPYVRFFPGTQKNSTPGIGGSPVVTTSITELQYAADIEYAHRLMPELSLGALIGIVFDNTTSVPAGTSNKTSVDYSKFEYQVSGTYFLNRNINLSLSVGAKKRILPYYPLEIQDFRGSFLAESAFTHSHFAYKYYYKTEAGGVRDETTNEISMNGFDINLGGGLEVPKTAELTLKLGLIAAISGRYKSQNVLTNIGTGASVINTAPEYDCYMDGMLMSADLKGRYHLDFVIIGARFAYTGLGIKRIYGYNAVPFDQSMSIIDTAFGVTLNIIENLLLPVEFVVQNASLIETRANEENTDTLTLLGVRIGAEYSLSREIKARAGFDFASGGQTHRSVFYNFVNDNSPYGTDTNPAINQLAFGLGIGYASGGFEGNAGLRFSLLSQNPLGQGMKEWSGSDIMLVTDIKLVM